MFNITTIFRILVITIVIVFVSWLVYSLVATLKENMQLEAAVVKWEAKYDLVLMAQQAGEEQIAKLVQDAEALQEELLIWQQKYKTVENKNKQAQSRIKQLEIDNESVRSILSTPIPDELWHSIFQDSKRYSSGDVSSEAK